MSKMDEIKDKVKSKEKERDARRELMGDDVKDPPQNVNINNDVNSEGDLDLEAIINTTRKAKFDKELVGIYFEPEVKTALDKYQKAEGRGAKSELLNDLAKYALKQKGYIK